MSANGVKRKISTSLASSSSRRSPNAVRVKLHDSATNAYGKSSTDKKMPLDQLEITWLGTSAGAPSKSRNVSATAMRLDGELWFIDAGEATQHQLQKSKLKISNASKIFLTHMHGDHVFGLVPFLCALADGGGGVVSGDDPRDKDSQRAPPIEIYGLTGLRRLIRTTLDCTYTHLARRYRVHELLFERDTAYDGLPNRNELLGRNIRIDADGCWRNFVTGDEKMHVSAVPIKHTVPCVGFIFHEPPRPGTIDVKLYKPMLDRNKDALRETPWNLDNPMKLLAQLQRMREAITLPDGSVMEPPPVSDNGRKIVLLGDTYDAESPAMDTLAMDADLLVHEATNAYLPGLDDALKGDDTMASVRERSRQHGHSTPQVAGQFARRVKAKNLFMNHFSARYVDVQSTLSSTLDSQGKIELDELVTVTDLGTRAAAPGSAEARADHDSRIACMLEIEKQATEAWDAGKRAVASRDFMSILVRRRKG